MIGTAGKHWPFIFMFHSLSGFEKIFLTQRILCHHLSAPFSPSQSQLAGGLSIGPRSILQIFQEVSIEHHKILLNTYALQLHRKCRPCINSLQHLIKSYNCSEKKSTRLNRINSFTYNIIPINIHNM